MSDLTQILVFIIVVYWTNADQQVVEQPQDQQAVIGDRTILKCKFSDLRGEPQWCIDDFCLGVSKKSSYQRNDSAYLKGRSRYKILGDRRKGEFHLMIEPVQLQDNMYFYCMATAASVTIKAVKSKRVFLTVLTYPQSLHLENPVHVSLNKPSSIQCKAKQSRPPVKIFISINGNLITDESKYKTEIIQYSAVQDEPKPVYVPSISAISNQNLRNSYYDTITNLTIDDVSISMEGQSVECFAYSLFYPNQKLNVVHKFASKSSHQNFMTTNSKIQVDYAPEVNLKMISSHEILKEEDVITLVCETKATPQIQSYKWYIGKNFLNGVQDSILNLKLTREMHLKTVTCEASNTVASVKAAIQLNILFKPWFIKGVASYLSIDKSGCNKPLTLDCQVKSNPKSNITWYRRRFATQSQIDELNEQKRSFFSLIGLGNRFFSKIEQPFEDQLIGYGPTYTISSFGCAGLPDDLNQIPKAPRKLKNKRNRRHADEMDDLEIHFRPVAYSNEYDDVYYDYYDYEDYQPVYDPKQSNPGQNDFGVYVCQAFNQLDQKASIHRFIKINPTGAPVSKIFPSSQNLSPEEQITLMMQSQDSIDKRESLTELAVSMGSSVTFACLIEPLPHLDSLIWIKDNGKIIPNSHFSIQNNTQNKTMSKNFKIKYENVTLNQKMLDIDIDQDIEEDNLSTQSKHVQSTNQRPLSLLKSVLHIKNIRKQDFGTYKCKATNAYGTRFTMVLLREKTLLDKLSLNNYIVFIMLVSSLVLSLVGLILLITCLFTHCSKKRNNFPSEKKVNDWLSLSQPNTVKQLKTTLGKNNTCSTTSEPLLMPSTSPLITDSSKSSKTSQTLTNSPRNESTANCSSLLDEEDEDKDSKLLTNLLHNQSTRFVVSSPMTASRVNQEHQPSMLLIRSQNFNAKISNCDPETRFTSLNRPPTKPINQEESPYRLSDLFNELSPMNTFSNTINSRLHNVYTSSPSSTLKQNRYKTFENTSHFHHLNI